MHLIDRLTVKSSALSYGFIPQVDICLLLAERYDDNLVSICTDQLRSINICLSREIYLFFFLQEQQHILMRSWEDVD